ncbi:Dot/Icm T4SS effector CirA [Coxiella burnetii]|uniref:Dot/Icm T4SS effector CirA n=1 Tax=Coxiella burnetii TaxID=777 RepID=UPI0004168ED9|nr:Dot/Icm T4SS effector CirA [Coxiella burnetii]
MRDGTTRVNTTGMRLKTITDVLIKLSQSSTHYDSAIFTSHKVKKFNLTTNENEPIEIWVYDDTSSSFPILTEYLKKHLESLIAAANHIFNRNEQLKKHWHETLVYIKKALEERLKFNIDLKQARKLVRDLINEIGFFWINQQPTMITTASQLYKGFLTKLFESVEIAIPDYKRNHILVIQQTGDIIKCEYYERGTSRSLRSNVENALIEYRFAENTHESEKTKDFPSAHYRGKLGLCNVATCFSATFDANNETTSCKIYYRHASFPPIDLYPLYRQERKELKNTKQRYLKKKNDMEEGGKAMVNWQNRAFKTQQCREGIKLITTRNMEMLRDLMRKNRSELELLPAERPPLIYTNISLLTVKQWMDKDFQEEQYHDTILAAERLRSRGNRENEDKFVPIMFNFGVNLQAKWQRRKSWWRPSLPKEQVFENDRAFFKFNHLVIERLQLIASKKTFSFAKTQALPHLWELNEIASSWNRYEKTLDCLANAYDAACNNYEKDPSKENIEYLQECEEKLSQAKKNLWKVADTHIAFYRKDFKQLIANRSNFSNDDSELQAILKDWKMFNSLYLRDAWHDASFSIQTSIGNLTRVVGSELSINCKSADDRTTGFCRRFEGSEEGKDAFSPHVRNDTDGGSIKFTGWAKTKKAKAIAKTEKKIAEAFSTHKLKKAVVAKSKIPTSHSLISSSSFWKLKAPDTSPFLTTNLPHPLSG